MANLCGTCKHFRPPIDRIELDGFPPNWGTCDCIRHRWHEGLDQAATGKEKAILEDVEEYQADLRVSDDFGCVLHEPS